MIVSYYRSRI